MEKVHPNMQKYRNLFAYFDQSKTESCDKEIALAHQKKNNKKWWFVAASFTLLAVLSTWLDNYYQNRRVEKQYFQVENALQILATNIEKSRKSINNLYTYEKTVNKIFNLK